MGETLEKLFDQAAAWALGHLASVNTVAQVAVVVGTLVLAWLLLRPARNVIDHIFASLDENERTHRARSLLQHLVLPVVWLGLLGGGAAALEDFGYGEQISLNVSSQTT